MSNDNNKKRKVIIVTREHEDYSNDYPLSNLINNKQQKQEKMSKSNLAAFEFAKCNRESFDDWLDKLDKWNDDLSNFIAAEQYEEWCDIPDLPIEPIDDCPVRKEDKKGCKNCNKPLYDKIVVNDNDEIYLLYWNRTKGFAKELGVLLPLICKDCGIAENTESENLLYIHDDEWGGRGNALLIFNNKKLDETNGKILDKLIELKFSFAAAFQHINSPGSFFHQILNMEFGEKPLFERLGDMEKENKCCEKLLESCDEVLKKPKQW